MCRMKWRARLYHEMGRSEGIRLREDDMNKRGGFYHGWTGLCPGRCPCDKEVTKAQATPNQAAIHHEVGSRMVPWLLQVESDRPYLGISYIYLPISIEFSLVPLKQNHVCTTEQVQRCGGSQRSWCVTQRAVRNENQPTFNLWWYVHFYAAPLARGQTST